ncbi:ligand-binding protein [Arsenicibacter rosenii]|uniref:Ligand-binding protein n=1 Tax=Arsenicibacter rosenii TaxID=1750698 RepID=A0A1S2VS01_9BACT|nr:ligand-binding protein [Arsenicibacter rosenii]
MGALVPSTFTYGQVTPGPVAIPGGLPGGTTPAGTSIPGSAQPGTSQQGKAQPGTTQSQQGRAGGVNQNTQQGRTTTGQSTQTNQGQGQGQNQNGTLQSTNDKANELDEKQAQKTNEEVIEEGYEAARTREKLEIRRKLFGSSVFNNPDLASAFQPNINVATPQNYVLGPGDKLNILMYGYTEADFSQSVSPDGTVFLGKLTGLGPVAVSGLTVEQAKIRIRNRLSQKFVGLKSYNGARPNTYLDLTVADLRSIRVSILGEAIRPGTYPVSSLATATNAIYQAGGPNELGSYRKVIVIRGGRVLATLDLYDYLLNGVQRNDVRLQDGDVIRFGTYQSRVEVTGTVKRNNLFELLPGETLDKVLYYAGGFAANAYKNRIKVTRLTDRERKVIDVTADQFANFGLQDGDVVTIEQLLDRFENQVNIEGAVYRPGRYSLDQNPTLRTLIQNAEGLRGDAFTGRIQILRTREDLSVENISLNLADIINGKAEDIVLKREDQVVITSRFSMAESATISIEGEVNQPTGDVLYVSNMTLEDLILKAGGLKEAAAAAQIEVVRRKKDVDITSKTAQLADVFRFQVNRDLTLDSDDSRFFLYPFDQVIVRRSPNYAAQTFARVEGEVIMPGQYPIDRKDIRISDLIRQAGGLSPYAYKEGATLQRPVKESAEQLAQRQKAIDELADVARNTVVQKTELVAGTLEPIGINLAKALANPGSAEDMIVEEGDVLLVPKYLETVRVQGEVLLPTNAKYRPGRTFQDYIAQAGGFTEKSRRRGAYIVYSNGSADRTRRFIIFNIYPRVEPGATITVPLRTATPLTPQQVLNSAIGITGSLLTLITTVLVLTRVGN